MDSNPPALNQVWRSFLGWSFDDLAASAEGPRIGVRVIGRESSLRFVAYRKQSTYGYSIYDASGKPLFKFLGDETGHQARSRGRPVKLPDAMVSTLLTRIVILTNAVPDFKVDSVTRDNRTGDSTYHVSLPWQTSLDVVLCSDGACVRITARGDRQNVYRPVKIAPLTRRHRSYSRWSVSGDADLNLERIVIGGIIYDGE
ncbi:MAG TPA: hypothetical protein VGD01_11555 [Candidatus Elarobacter sp.]|jgi:hypothetical protein